MAADCVVHLTTNFIEEDISSAIHPYNAYVHPFTHLKRPESMSQSSWAMRLQRLLVPTIMSAGLDHHQIIAERNRFIEARIAQRIHELSTLPATIDDGSLEQPLPSSSPDNENQMQQRTISPFCELSHAHGKLRAITKLKALMVRTKQRALRAQVVEHLTHGTLPPLDRKDFRRTRKTRLLRWSDLRARSRDGRERTRYVGSNVESWPCAAQAFHAFTEKEKAKHIERISKEALKSDDEEVYMKLIDTAEGARITHLILNSLAPLDERAATTEAECYAEASSGLGSLGHEGAYRSQSSRSFSVASCPVKRSQIRARTVKAKCSEDSVGKQ
ncbi:hypothetical protein BD410DRAFT_847134 [Rickenella mellea]|uniref:Uncharacterized protein n=1 Tax=Rickenella mellea TaxID=50990 RepID=A0A4Y7PDA0_9AGAM|nr:hypothetical protein BD410DRAFT_847134 [Rickenella mellea]